MVRFRLYWEFYKSTFIINFGSSVIASLFVFPDTFKIFPLAIMTVGPLLAFFYKEITRKNEYFFYYNQGLSKFRLIASCMLVNILIGGILLTFMPHVSITTD